MSEHEQEQQADDPQPQNVPAGSYYDASSGQWVPPNTASSSVGVTLAASGAATPPEGEEDNPERDENPELYAEMVAQGKR